MNAESLKNYYMDAINFIILVFVIPFFMELLCCFNHTQITPGPMSEQWEIYADWNPWHGCTKISAECKYCYVYRQDEMYGSDVASNLARKTGAFFLPVIRKRDRLWKDRKRQNSTKGFCDFIKRRAAMY